MTGGGALRLVPAGAVAGDGAEASPPGGGGGGGDDEDEPRARQAIVLRYGELTLKGANRGRFVDAVGRSIRRAVASLGATVRPMYGRCLVEGVGHSPEALARLRLVFGLSSVSPAWLLGKGAPDADRAIDEWSRTAIRLAGGAVARGARTFAVAAERPDKSFPLRSNEINARLGDAVRLATGMTVDLGRPDWKFRVEVGREAVFAWEGTLPGAGGLPVGMGGRAMLLLSGGLDSPVAGHLAQKRGVTLDAVYFDAFPYTGPGAREKAVDLARILARAQMTIDLHVVPFARVQEALRDGAPADHLVILYRRAMVRIAERLCLHAGGSALVTGESLGQVASQTIENIRCIDAAATMPVLRPLISFDKSETIALARRLGTYEISIRPHADCCSLFVPKHPVTRGAPERVERIEAGVASGPAVEEAVAGVEVVTVDAEEG
ncbi:MAG: tRNA uracil 4-sulfurtransferase ThiI [Myxococcota bacterium]|nr:tRNA uracil 4-sulfurtransferase ThiI [Myxococcota bacterium]